MSVELLQRSSRRPAWIWPWRPSATISRRTLTQAQRLADAVGPLPNWLLLGAVCGALPLLCGYATQWPGAGLLGSLLIVPLVVAAASRDRLLHGLAAVGAAFGAHGALAIAIVAHDPDSLVKVLTGGNAYWMQSRQWIVTGVSREYELNWWLPAYFQHVSAMVLFTYTSMGLVTLWQGFYEADLMNFYVGQLIAHSQSPWVAVAVGWHPWSVCRGMGYLFLTFEVVSLSLERLTGLPLSTAPRRRLRWALGLTFLVADGLVKYFFLETVRGALASNLL